MTFEEVEKFIDGHPTWTPEEKLGMHSLHGAYRAFAKYPQGTQAYKNAEKFRNQLLEYGIRV